LQYRGVEGRAGQESGKLHEKDRIVAVAQSNSPAVDVEGMPAGQDRGNDPWRQGTQVTLTVIPHDAPDSSVRKNISLIRDEIKLEDLDAKARLYETPEPTAALTIEPTAPFHANTRPRCNSPPALE